jgi:DNA invertase Pin-like site-specific DNA recombinase
LRAPRRALQQLIKDVEAGIADFQIILVYDVSRWGRFQDADESAYYEYICRRAGIQVAYCAEQFENDGSPVSTIVKGVKRAMAGEYSRELSAKVFEALWSFKGAEVDGERIMQRAGQKSDKPIDLFKIKSKDKGKPEHEARLAAYGALVVTQQRAGLYSMPCAAVVLA